MILVFGVSALGKLKWNMHAYIYVYTHACTHLFIYRYTSRASDKCFNLFFIVPISDKVDSTMILLAPDEILLHFS